jgi:riboflavin kinase/FMN adenylyltransferase
MDLIRGIHNLREQQQGCVATIGVYDGVHIGHQQIIRQVCETARAKSLPSVVVTFEPTPQEYFQGDAAPARLTRLREKIPVIADMGVEWLLCLPFGEHLATVTAQTFIDRLLIARLGIKSLIVGGDFRFGKNREGDLAMLIKAGAEKDFDVAGIKSVLVDGDRVSSTVIREALGEGDLANAARMLGRRYSMCGRVIQGRQLGRKLGYPTANIAVHRRVTALHGIFAVRVYGAAENVLPGVASLGTRPTVDGDALLLEVHVIDYDANLYGRALRVEFVERLRDELRFESIDLLTEQMKQDELKAREVLENPA